LTLPGRRTMPELPEVQRIVGILGNAIVGRAIESVNTAEDTIVYADGLTHGTFVSPSFTSKTRNILMERSTMDIG